MTAWNLQVLRSNVDKWHTYTHTDISNFFLLHTFMYGNTVFFMAGIAWVPASTQIPKVSQKSGPLEIHLWKSFVVVALGESCFQPHWNFLSGSPTAITLGGGPPGGAGLPWENLQRSPPQRVVVGPKGKPVKYAHVNIYKHVLPLCICGHTCICTCRSVWVCMCRALWYMNRRLLRM